MELGPPFLPLDASAAAAGALALNRSASLGDSSLIGSSGAWGSLRSNSGSSSSRHAGLATALATGARFEAVSSYARDFGAAAALTAAQTAASAAPLGAADARAAITLCATTAELGVGTARANRHPPGYTGFVPAAATAAAATARAHGAGLAPRADAGPGVLLAALDQYSRARLPGCTTHKPRGGAAAALTDDPARATAATASGFAGTQLAARGPQPYDGKFASDSRAGLMSFFSAGCNGSGARGGARGGGGGAGASGGGGEPSTSDNGLSDAQRFFGLLRPLEGRPKGGAVASRTTAAGARFDSPMARAARGF